jgi:GDPmannose 4,6-dehydratase
MTSKVALISGVTGQDGSYLAELLISKDYEVHGIIRRSSSVNTERVEHLRVEHILDAAPAGKRGGLRLHYGDLTDEGSLRSILEAVRPDDVYNLAAQSHVRTSFDLPVYTCDVVTSGALRMLDAVRHYVECSGHKTRYYQASSSEMFGAAEPPQNEETPFWPRSPYAAAKVGAFYFAKNYREAYGLFAVNGILFNHESPRRGEGFVTRKITRAATRIKLGLQSKLHLGNLEAKRDWGFAGEYVEVMWRMLQLDEPHDFVIGTGVSISVRQFLELVFSELDLSWQDYVEFDPAYLRPTEVDYLQADALKAERLLGWRAKVGVGELAKMMVASDLRLAEQERILADAGHFRPLHGV